MPRNPADIVASLPLSDRIRLLSGRDVWHTQPIGEHDVAAATLSDGPHGLRKQEVGGDHLGATGSNPATCYPTAAALASSWDVELLHEVGAAVGAEAVAEQVAVVLGPGLNIKRHPFCGRNFEYFSEDPLLAGKLAAAMVRGIQSAGVGACVKHFAVNNQETHRLVIDAVLDERTLREIYLTGFEIAVREGQPWTVMASYNKVNGEYACDNRRLLTEILRAEWGFEGLVMSDWGATNDRVAGVRAGMDLEMPGGHGLSDADVLAAVRSGALDERDVNVSATRVVALALRNRPAPGTHSVDRHHALARRAAAHSSVLLTNNGLLPLRADAVAPMTVALIGAFATQPRYQGAGSSLVNPTRVETALDELTSIEGVTVRYAPGYDPMTSVPDRALLHEAAEVARSVDVAVVMVGLPAAYESEGFDRTHLRLPAQHDDLVNAVCAANPRTVVALSNGSAVAMPWVERPAAIVESYLGGQASGSALVDVLFGVEDPVGRLAESFPIAVTDVPSDAYFPGTRHQVQHREGVFVGYRYYDSAGTDVLFPFGHGLSYTTFDFADLQLGDGQITVKVTNTGERRGAEVVQVYVHQVGSARRRPDQELRGFTKTWLDPGESRVVSIPLGDRAFAWYDPQAGAWRVPAATFEIRVGASSRDIRLTAQLTVEGDPAAVPPAAPTGLIARSDAEFAELLGHPVPAEPPVRPFTRTSTLGDLRRTRTGRAVRSGLLRVLTPMLTDIAGGDAAMAARLVAAADEAPLRQLAQFSDGKITWPMLDAVLDVLNGRPSSLGRYLLGRLDPRR